MEAVHADRAVENNNGLHGGSADKNAATKLQKVYRSYRTRRRLADSAVVAEEFWWRVLDYARLNHSTISFFDHLNNPEPAISRWTRVTLNASKVGHGLCRDDRALTLAFWHWIEAIDPRHRYGHNLEFYYKEWCKSEAGQPFFYWLDVGEGRDMDLKECPRCLLRKQCIKYLGPKEREHYEYVIREGKIIHKQSGDLLDTNSGSDDNDTKCIFVMSSAKRIYAGQKKKGKFHHSSFLAGGAMIAAGRLTVHDGIFKCISAHSGHYRPKEENLNNFLEFLELNGVDLNTVEVRKSASEDYYEDSSLAQVEKVIKEENIQLEENAGENAGNEDKGGYKRTLSGGLQNPTAEVPKKAVLERINSKREMNSYQLGRQLSRTWSTGAGPRISCVADYPVELRTQALEFVCLSPRESDANLATPLAI